MLRLKEKQRQVISAIIQKFGYKNPMAVPKIEKVVINTGFGRMITDKTGEEQKKIRQAILNDLALITGQRPVLARAKKSISGFKIRKGMPIGAKVTLRRQKMYDFLDRVIHIALPRSRDFKGIDLKNIDKKGSLTIPIKEHISFPEVLPEKTKFIFGLEITIVTTAQTREEGLELFRQLGFPLKFQ